MKRIMLFVLSALLLAGCASGGSGGYQRISMEEAAVRMEKETGFILLDVRTQEEFAQGHIPGAVCIPNETISSETVTALSDPGQLIFVYCRSGNRSRQAADKLVKLGYTNIVEIGGIRSWTGPITTEP